MRVTHLAITVLLLALAVADASGADDWWNAQWHYRGIFDLPKALYDRKGHTVELVVDIARLFYEYRKGDFE